MNKLNAHTLLIRNEWDERRSWCDRIDRVGPPSTEAKALTRTSNANHNYWMETVVICLGHEALPPACLLDCWIALTHARCTANSSSDTIMNWTETTQLHFDVHTNITIIIKLDARHKFRSVCKVQLGHLWAGYRSLDLIKKVKVHTSYASCTIDSRSRQIQFARL